MITDILTMMWKEGKWQLCTRGSRTKFLLTFLIPVVMLGIYLPLQIGRALVEGPWTLLASIFIPMMIVGMAIPESFAGERERHTLETLLASRLTDRAILLGKIIVAVGFAWGMTLMLHLLSLVMVNVFLWNGQILIYTPIMAIANVSLSLLIAIFIASLDVLISLRSATVQEAQQTLMTATLFPLVILQLIPLLLLNVVPDGIALLEELVMAANPSQIVFIIMAVLIVLDLVLLGAATIHFKQTRLILG